MRIMEARIAYRGGEAASEQMKDVLEDGSLTMALALAGYGKSKRY